MVRVVPWTIDYVGASPKSAIAVKFPRAAPDHGAVDFEMCVSEKGKVVYAQARCSSHSKFTEAVEHAALDVKFEPATVQGRPIASCFFQSVKFGN